MQDSNSKNSDRSNTAVMLANRKKMRNRPIAVHKNDVPRVSQVINTVSSALSTVSVENSGSWISKAFSIAKNLALRIVVHFFAFMCAAFTIDITPDDPGRYVAPLFAVYFGIICLVPRGMSTKAQWIVPVVGGVAQTFIALALKFPMPEALLWGGVQTFVQRMIVKRLDMGTEWIVALCLTPLIFIYSTKLFSSFILCASFIAIAGFLGGFGFLRAHLEARKVAMEARKAEQEKNAAVQRLQQEKTGDPYYIHLESIADLRSKLLLLPQEMQAVVIELTKYAEAIIVCMRQDKRDQEPGEKFLKRYLPATHSVLENYYKLSGASVGNDASAQNIQKALKESEEVLKRLEDAFKQEHSILLRNDVDDFSADLRVLDTLLKMDGR